MLLADDNKNDLALPPGSLILVTGASGYIASNIIREALEAGYRVRGTARSQAKVDKTISCHQSHGTNYEGVVVEDMQSPSAFHDAIKGVDAVIHTANVMTFSADPSTVVPASVDGALSIMTAALDNTSSSVKRFVYTSSSTAATNPKPGVKFTIDRTTWNDDVDKYGDMEGDLGAENAFNVYACSKLRAERAVWEFVRDKKPAFVVNCVLPNANFGRVIDSPGASGSMVTDALKGVKTRLGTPQYMVDVIDDARVHLAAAVDKTIANERIFGFAWPYNYNIVVDAVREARPDAKVPERDADDIQDLSEVDNVLGAQLLKKWYGQDGWKGLIQSVKENLDSLGA